MCRKDLLFSFLYSASFLKGALNSFGPLINNYQMPFSCSILSALNKECRYVQKHNAIVFIAEPKIWNANWSAWKSSDFTQRSHQFPRTHNVWGFQVSCKTQTNLEVWQWGWMRWSLRVPSNPTQTNRWLNAVNETIERRRVAENKLTFLTWFLLAIFSLSCVSLQPRSKFFLVSLSCTAVRCARNT